MNIEGKISSWKDKASNISSHRQLQDRACQTRDECRKVKHLATTLRRFRASLAGYTQGGGQKWRLSRTARPSGRKLIFVQSSGCLQFMDGCGRPGQLMKSLLSVVDRWRGLIAGLYSATIAWRFVTHSLRQSLCREKQVWLLLLLTRRPRDLSLDATEKWNTSTALFPTL